jgi:hypothetical protein
MLAQEGRHRRRIARTDRVGDPARQRSVGPQHRRLGGQVVRGRGGGRLARRAGAGERGGAVAVVLHAHDAPVARGGDHAGLPARRSPLGQTRAGDLDEHHRQARRLSRRRVRPSNRRGRASGGATG